MSERMEGRLKDLAQVVAYLAGEMSVMVASAESCTGGLVARMLTSIPGASDWYHTGIVSYTCHSKHHVLGIPSDVLTGGLVTSATAEAMAEHVANLSGADYSVSTTGVSGPSASEGHEPCFAWIGVKTPRGVTTTCVENTDEGRDENTQWIALQALRLLADALREGREGK